MTWSPWWTHGVPTSSATWTPGWDAGLTVYTVSRVWDSDELPNNLSVGYIRDKVLRVTNWSLEDEFIEHAIKAGIETCEAETQQALLPQTITVRSSGFPLTWFELPWPPFIELVSVGYVDGDDADQVIDLDDVRLVPSGQYRRARLETGSSWPSTAIRGDAVTLTYRAGMTTGASPEEVSIPARLAHGISLFVGELYKQRSLSVTGTSVVPAVLDTRRFWEKKY